MNDEPMNDVDELKARLQEEIKIEEEETYKAETAAAAGSVSEALREFGEQLARTVQTAWESEQRQEVEREIRQGMNAFAAEMERVVKEVRESTAGQRVKEEAAEIKTSVESGEAGHKARTTIVQGLKWLSDELSRLADQFSPPEKEPTED